MRIQWMRFSFLLGGTEIDHYLAMTMSAIPQINDLVGGVPVTVLDDFSGIDDSLVKGEEITLMGEQALQLCSGSRRSGGQHKP